MIIIESVYDQFCQYMQLLLGATDQVSAMGSLLFAWEFLGLLFKLMFASTYGMHGKMWACGTEP